MHWSSSAEAHGALWSPTYRMSSPATPSDFSTCAPHYIKVHADRAVLKGKPCFSKLEFAALLHYKRHQTLLRHALSVAGGPAATDAAHGMRRPVAPVARAGVTPAKVLRTVVALPPQ